MPIPSNDSENSQARHLGDAKGGGAGGKAGGGGGDRHVSDGGWIAARAAASISASEVRSSGVGRAGGAELV